MKFILGIISFLFCIVCVSPTIAKINELHASASKSDTEPTIQEHIQKDRSSWTIRIAVNKDLSGLIDLSSSIYYPMKDGVARTAESKTGFTGFFTYEALNKVLRQHLKKKSELLLKTPFPTAPYPLNGEHGLIYVSWDKDTLKGVALPVMFDLSEEIIKDQFGNLWIRGEYWIYKQQETLKEKWKYYQPE